MSVLVTAAFVYATIQSPFLLFCSYPLLKKHQWAASPWLAGTACSITGVFFFFYATGSVGYDHFLYYPAFFCVMDFLLVFRFRYSKADALVLSGLTVVLADQIWQLPVNLAASSHLIGPAAPWQWMSLPLLIYFLVKMDGGMRLDFMSGLLLAESLALTVFAYAAYSLYEWPDYLLIVWFLFFLSLFASSRPPRPPPHSASAPPSALSGGAPAPRRPSTRT